MSNWKLWTSGILAVVVGSAVAVGAAESCTARAQRQYGQNAAEQVLAKLSARAKQLRFYQAKLEYKFIQPLLESESLRTGRLYYGRYGDQSRLRINFETLRHEDEKEQKYAEHYIFDGRWLVQINYEVKAVRKYELAEPNKPIDAFELARRHLPLVGFTKAQELRKDFEIEVVGDKIQEGSRFVQLRLTVKPNSRYKDDYQRIDFWIDKKIWLPSKVVAVSTEEDIYELKFLEPKVNVAIDKKIFRYKIPADFGEPEIVPLQKKGQQKRKQ